MADPAQLAAWRDALMAARYRGVRTVEYDGKRILECCLNAFLACSGRKVLRRLHFGGMVFVGLGPELVEAVEL
jgi:hypothetical protein